MEIQFYRSRGVMAIRGLLTIMFGLTALFWPSLTLQTVVILIGAYIFTDGLLATVITIRSQYPRRLFGFSLIEGISGIVAGLTAIAWPGLTALAIAILVGVWSILTGVLEVGVSQELRRELHVHTALLPVGILSLLLGIYLVIFPVQAATIVTWLVGFYALVAGSLMVMFAISRNKDSGGPRTGRIGPTI